jgi:hypothetical protein
VSDVPEPDFGAEEFQWPEVNQLRPAQAARLLDDIERQAAEANKRADRLKSRKAQAQQIVIAVADEYEEESVRFRSNTGRVVQYTPSVKQHFTIENEAEFKEWAGAQSENFYDPEPKLREGVFRDEMRRRMQDGEGLPPGVRKYDAIGLSRSSVAGA